MAGAGEERERTGAGEERRTAASRGGAGTHDATAARENKQTQTMHKFGRERSMRGARAEVKRGRRERRREAESGCSAVTPPQRRPCFHTRPSGDLQRAMCVLVHKTMFRKVQAFSLCDRTNEGAGVPGLTSTRLPAVSPCHCHCLPPLLPPLPPLLPLPPSPPAPS